MKNTNFKDLCVVTYTSIDNKVRQHIVSIPVLNFNSNRETIVNSVTELCEFKQWSIDYLNKNGKILEWGLAPYGTYGTRCYSERIAAPTEAHFFFYRLVLQAGIVSQLAMECSKNREFSNTILKEAAIRAKSKDAAKSMHGYSDALNRAKNRIRYQQKTRPLEHDDYFEFLRIIEAFELFTICNIQPCI